MNKISDITPTINTFHGTLDAVTFTVTGTAPGGVKASVPVSEILGEPIAPADGTFTADELLAACDAIAKARDIYAQVDRLVLIAQTPAYAPPVIAQPSDAEVRAQLEQQVDYAARSLYAKFDAFRLEYEPREAAARAYREAGYSGDPTSWVTAFTESAGLTLQAGVDRIIAQADSLRAAIKTLAGLRMQKYLITSNNSQDGARAKCKQILDDIAALGASLT